MSADGDAGGLAKPVTAPGAAPAPGPPPPTAAAATGGVHASFLDEAAKLVATAVSRKAPVKKGKKKPKPARRTAASAPSDGGPSDASSSSSDEPSDRPPRSAAPPPPPRSKRVASPPAGLREAVLDRSVSGAAAETEASQPATPAAPVADPVPPPPVATPEPPPPPVATSSEPPPQPSTTSLPTTPAGPAPVGLAAASTPRSATPTPRRPKPAKPPPPPVDPEVATRRAEAKERERAEAEAARAAARAKAAAREAAAREAQRAAARERREAERLKAAREKEDREAAQKAAAERAARRAATKQNRAAKNKAAAAQQARRKRVASFTGAVGGAADAVVAAGGVAGALIRLVAATLAAGLTVSAELARVPARLAIARVAGDDAAATTLRRPRGAWSGAAFDVATLIVGGILARALFIGAWRGAVWTWTAGGVPALRALRAAAAVLARGGRAAAAVAVLRPIFATWTHLIWRPRWYTAAAEIVALFIAQTCLPPPLGVVAATLLTHPAAWWLASRAPGLIVSIISITAFLGVVALYPGPQAALIALASDVALATPAALAAIVAAWRTPALPWLSRIVINLVAAGAWWAWVGNGGARRRARPRAWFGGIVRHLADETVDGAPDEVARVLRSADYYEVLGVARGAGDADVKRAWMQLCRRVHPDKLARGGGPVPGADRAMARVSEAYEKLANADARARYDDELAAAAAAAAAEADDAAAADATPAASMELECECGRTHRLRPVARAPAATCLTCGTQHAPAPGDVFCERVFPPGARKARRVYYMHAGNAIFDITAAAECDQSRLASARAIRRGECVLERRR